MTREREREERIEIEGIVMHCVIKNIKGRKRVGTKLL